MSPVTVNCAFRQIGSGEQVKISERKSKKMENGNSSKDKEGDFTHDLRKNKTLEFIARYAN